MRRRALVAMALATLTVWLPARAFAAVAPTPDLTLVPGAEQARDTESGGIRVVAQPGGGVWAAATLTNISAQSLTVELAGADGTASWIRPSVPSLLLAAHETTTVRFTVAPPRDAKNETTTARFVVTAANTPTITASLPVVVDVIGSPAAVPASAATGGVASAGADAAGNTQDGKGTRRSATDVALTWAIILALGVVVARTFMPAGAWLVRQVMARTQPRALDLDELNRLLDLDALNRELQLASTPSHGTRAASAHNRSRP
jgi:hypothetical protein